MFVPTTSFQQATNWVLDRRVVDSLAEGDCMPCSSSGMSSSRCRRRKRPTRLARCAAGLGSIGTERQQRKSISQRLGTGPSQPLCYSQHTLSMDVHGVEWVMHDIDAKIANQVMLTFKVGVRLFSEIGVEMNATAFVCPTHSQHSTCSIHQHPRLYHLPLSSLSNSRRLFHTSLPKETPETLHRNVERKRRDQHPG